MPAPSAIEAFSKRLKDYKTVKGAVQFPHKLPLPLGKPAGDIVTVTIREKQK